MNIPERFTIHITDNCNLSCKFCWINKKTDDTGIMCINEFSRIIEWLESEGVRKIDLTPMSGEVFTIKNITDYFDIVENSSIEDFIVFTNLTLDFDYRHLSKYKKLKLVISLYGTDNKSYTKITGQPLFNKVIKHLGTLKLVNKPTIIVRYQSETPLWLVAYLKTREFNIVETEKDNRKNRFGDELGFEGESCIFSQEPIIHKKGVSFCCMDYYKDKMIIGNIGERLSDIYSRLNSLLHCNKTCGWYKE